MLAQCALPHQNRLGFLRRGLDLLEMKGDFALLNLVHRYPTVDRY